MNRLICSIYRSPKKEGMYLYVEKKDELRRVPDALLELFGTPQSAMTMLIDEDKKLARAKAVDVIAEINDKGFYLQFPPVEDSDMKEIAEKNSKLGKL